MIEPLANIFTGAVSASITGAGVYLGRIATIDPIIKLTSLVASPIFAYLAARKVPFESHAKLGSIIAGIIFGGVIGTDPDTILKNSLCLVTISGVGGYLANVL